MIYLHTDEVFSTVNAGVSPILSANAEPPFGTSANTEVNGGGGG